jgi:threonine aldolase
MISFESDYNNGAHPKVLQHIIDTNNTNSKSYGYDDWSENAKKKIKQIAKVTKAHEQLKSTVKNAIRNTDKAVAAGNKELAEKHLNLAIKSLDNAKSKGLVHRNKVDREKSRLTLKVNKMESK